MTAPTPSRQTDRLESQKQEAAKRAVEFVESGMVVGLGAGSTAAFAVRRIAELLRQGQLHDIVGIPCSSAVGAAARQLGIPLTTLEDCAADRSHDRRCGRGGSRPKLDKRRWRLLAFTRRSSPRRADERSSSSTPASPRRGWARSGRCPWR